MASAENIFDTAYRRQLLARVDDGVFQAALSHAPTPTPVDELIELKVGAMVDYESWVNEIDVGAAIGTSPNISEVTASHVFDQWLAYVGAASAQRRIELRDLFLASSVALWARRPTELRHLLRLPTVSEIIEPNSDDTRSWPVKVQEIISRALILIARQSSREDVEKARRCIDDLRQLQGKMDEAILASTDQPQRSALTLLSLYHAGQATIVLTDYVLNGQFVGTRGRPVNVMTELQTLVRKAHEYAVLSSDPELMTWIISVSLISGKLRDDSIWANGSNINEKIDALVRSVSTREGAILSMLPSQQDALAKNLLDPQREAVILQMPTSSGKTLMAELAILQTLSGYADARVIYVTPTRALATQVRRTLGADFAELNIDVTAAGSAFEEDPFEQALLNSLSGVVVSTPEKLDLLLRSRTEWFERIRLVIVDEAHLLKDGERGARLELLLANIRREHAHIRLLLLTPFVENAQDVAAWLSQDRGREVEVKWRPSRLIVGLASLKGRQGTRRIEIEWKEPHRSSELRPTVMLLTDEERDALRESSSAQTKAITIGRRLQPLGPALMMFPASRIAAEEAALEMAGPRAEIDPAFAPPEFRVAIALASNEYGENSQLANCLRKGVAFHHSALSSELRYLVERLAAIGTLQFIAATTTLAQGMNFPVSSVIVHSVHKPYAGPLSPGEFWNIAGRAGRVGLSERGVIVFANSEHRGLWEHYTASLSEQIDSALAVAIERIADGADIKTSYRTNEGIRPFIQYIGHSVARLGSQQTSSELERLVNASFAGRSDAARAKLLQFARRYLGQITGKQQSYMKVADETGLASFTFDELYATIRTDPVLSGGTAQMLQQPDGLKHLIDALAKLPELSLALDLGHGTIDTKAVADVVHKWINGSTVAEIAPSFRGASEADRIREAGRYVFGLVSQTVSWGAHAFLRGRDMIGGEGAALEGEDRMLPAYIQYGVSSPGSVIASILGIPRQLASGMAALYSEENGLLRPEDGSRFRAFLETSRVEVWREAIQGTRIADFVSADDLRLVWRDSQGIDRRRAQTPVRG
ncbi:DEAD/DEAH box type DNA/RNA helicase protein (plasmid) [Rhizobium phaseoli]|uniref:DEAD/DEAH box helicase n=1 Tax=Rhizobium phaseoli TaxID=396 RepID=UPI0007E9371C|nr:DEAD/DEAH box helicase [Rhizobium phaseoli]ANL76413.1 DEAD/DEAH box type DNA/RNA helicase protein [Rhizobium phaseoli]